MLRSLAHALATSLLLAVVAAPPAAADDCGRCSPTKSCKPHAEAEAAELERLREDLESDQARTRERALRQLAGLTDERQNAPSRSLAEFLAEVALEDELLRVRAAAIDVLCEGQHPEVAVKTTIEMIAGFKRNMWTLVETMMGPDGRHGGVDDAMRLLETTLRSAGNLRDDRIVKALVDVLRAFPTEMRGEPVAMAASRSLLELGTPAAVEAVIDQLGVKIEDSRRRNIHRALESFAGDLEIEETPADGSDLAKAWEAWLRKHRRALPKKLGKWKGPPRDEDAS